jgi:hypothetical protein
VDANLPACRAYMTIRYESNKLILVGGYASDTSKQGNMINLHKILEIYFADVWIFDLTDKTWQLETSTSTMGKNGFFTSDVIINLYYSKILRIQAMEISWYMEVMEERVFQISPIFGSSTLN